MQLHEIVLKNTGTFKDVTIPVDKNSGLVVIRGKNLDSQEPDNTNGAGKSLLMSAMTTALFERSPVTDLNTKAKDKKELLQKGSEISLAYTGVNGKRYVFTQKPSKYVVTEDGQDLKFVKQDLAKAKLKQTTLFSEEEFYSSCYIQNTKPLVFQHTTPANRLHFITDLFDLHVFDHIRSEINKERGRIKEASIEFDTINGQLDIANRKVKDFSERVVSKSEIKGLKRKREKLNSKFKKLFRRQQKLSSQIETFEKVEANLKTRASLRKKLKGVDAARSQVKRWIAQFYAYAEYKEDLEEYETRVKALKAKVAKYKSNHNSKDLKTELRALEKSFDKLEDKQRAYYEAKEKLDSLKSDLSDVDRSLSKINVSPKLYDSLDIDEDFCKSTVKLYNRLVDHVDHEDSTCPTCGSNVDLKALRINAKKALRQLEKLKEAKKAKELHQTKKELEKEITKMRIPSFDKKQFKALPLKIEKLEQKLENLDKYSSYKAQLDGISKPKKVTKPDTSYNLQELENIYKHMKALEIVGAKLEDVELSDDIEATRKLNRELKQKLEQYSERLSALDGKITQSRVIAKEFEMLQKTAAELTIQLESSSSIVESRKLFDFLFKQYGSTEIKLQAASRILKILENSLNTYSSLVFVEPFQFKIEPTAKGIEAVYRTKESGNWVNISRLSGAETNCLRLLFCVALLPLIPKERRPNFIVLDEPDAACSEVVRQRLIKDFLPKLRSIVPHVFWITPKEVDSFKEAEVWTVIKENGVSRLEFN
tara:strand:- start:2648 stop:4942 length:2295 start_codon:yes stop_codon:yes gene_type:complete